MLTRFRLTVFWSFVNVTALAWGGRTTTEGIAPVGAPSQLLVSAAIIAAVRMGRILIMLTQDFCNSDMLLKFGLMISPRLLLLFYTSWWHPFSTSVHLELTFISGERSGLHRYLRSGYPVLVHLTVWEICALEPTFIFWEWSELHRYLRSVKLSHAGPLNRCFFLTVGEVAWLKGIPPPL